MDPLRITVGALGITEFALFSIKELRNFINDVAEAGEVVHDVASSLEDIQRPLTALEAFKISDKATYIKAREDLEKTGVVEAVNKCGDACAEFTKRLKKWTKHSSSGKLSLRDRLSVGVLNKEKIRSLRTRVQSCQTAVQFAITSTQLIVQLRYAHTSEIDREELKQQLQALEIRIQEHLNLTKKKQEEAQKRKNELQVEPEEEEEHDYDQRINAIKEVEEQSRVLEDDLVSSGVVFSQSQSQRTNQDISKVMVSEYSKAWVGLPESVVGKINQRIKDVTVQKNSSAAVGVFKGDIIF